MSSITTSVGVVRGRGRSWIDRLADEGLLVIVVGMVFAVLGAAASPFLLQPDSWLTFVGGREVAHSGVPHVDSLTIMSNGRTWVDQQWLGQLASYRLVQAIGIGATIAVFTILVALAYALGCMYARRSASSRSVAVFALLAAPLAYCAVRAQALSYLIFVPFFALLCRESRRPTRRVWLVLPVLVVWANLHGAVLVGAAIVGLFGLLELFERRIARGVGLMVGASLSVLATPYGLGILDYYRSTMGNPLFKRYITEWASPTFFSPVGVALFLGAALAIALIARHPRVLTRFEIGALVLTFAGGMTALRSVVWFAYAALQIMPRVLDRAWPSRRMTGVARTAIASVAVLVVTAALGFSLATVHNSARRLAVAYPPGALRAVDGALAADPHARVLADDRTSDWLLYELPAIRNRMAFDGRWEVYSQPQFWLIRNYVTQKATGVDRLAHGYQIFVVDRGWHPELARWYAARRDLRVLYRGSRVLVYERT